MSYDIIGDIHGHAAKLKELLAALGYRHEDGAWRHSRRTAIFVGDFIDSGPDQVETVRIVREMVKSRTAQAVMGNHEFNAISWFTPDPNSPDEYLRKHTDENREQTAAFLREVEGDPAVHEEIIAWFSTLPLWLDLPGLSVVHACWHPAYMAQLAPFLGPGHTLTESLVVAASREGSMEFRAVEGLTKGIEVDLPAGRSFLDAYGKTRQKVRVQWWDDSLNTYREAAHTKPELRAVLPNARIPDNALVGYRGSKPVFFGHYWCRGTPSPLTPRAACVDYSAARGGPLVAYRWDGETQLRQDSFVAVGHG